MATITLLFVSIVPLVKALPLDTHANHSGTSNNAQERIHQSATMTFWYWFIIIASVAVAGIGLLCWIAQVIFTACYPHSQRESESTCQDARYTGERVLTPMHEQPARYNVVLPSYASTGPYSVQQEEHYKPRVYPLSSMPPLAIQTPTISSGWDQSGSYSPAFSRQYNPSRQYHG